MARSTKQYILAKGDPLLLDFPGQVVFSLLRTIARSDPARPRDRARHAALVRELLREGLTLVWECEAALERLPRIRSGRMRNRLPRRMLRK